MGEKAFDHVQPAKYSVASTFGYSQAEDCHVRKGTDEMVQFPCSSFLTHLLDVRILGHQLNGKTMVFSGQQSACGTEFESLLMFVLRPSLSLANIWSQTCYSSVFH